MEVNHVSSETQGTVLIRTFQIRDVNLNVINPIFKTTRVKSKYINPGLIIYLVTGGRGYGETISSSKLGFYQRHSRNPRLYFGIDRKDREMAKKYWSQNYTSAMPVSLPILSYFVILPSRLASLSKPYSRNQLKFSANANIKREPSFV